MQIITHVVGVGVLPQILKQVCSSSWGSIHTENWILCFNNRVLYVLYVLHLEWKVIKLLELLELAAHFVYDLHHGNHDQEGRGGGGYSELSVMIEWGQKSKPKKIPGKKIKAQKMPFQICAP